MSLILLSKQWGDQTFELVAGPDGGCPGITLCPTSMVADRVNPRASLGEGSDIALNPLRANFPPPRRVEPLLQTKKAGDAFGSGFSAGRTMRDSATMKALRFVTMEEKQSDDGSETLVVRMADEKGFEGEQYFVFRKGVLAIETYSRIFNRGSETVTLDLLSSFCLGGITPFHEADAPGRLMLHRFRSNWSAEGRIESALVEKYGLERSWAGHSMAVERFGQIGSFPVRGFFPVVAVEDRIAGVTWAAQIAWGGSWQIEITRQDDAITLTGGLADREYGHWAKVVPPAKSFESPHAFLTVGQGSWQETYQRLVRTQETLSVAENKWEESGGITYNEWCRSWGKPSHQDLVEVAAHLSGSPVRYLVIDAGWYRNGQSAALSGHGDWQASEEFFPDGLGATAAAIREQGLIPGLWFEMETCGKFSQAFHRTERVAHRDGVPLTVGVRRFLDLRQEAVMKEISDVVIRQLRDHGFGYLKVDYNDSVGVGIDGDDSLGEGLRALTCRSYDLFDQIRRELPDLVIENCASGGHRLEYGYVTRTSMSSFSDAHESVEIPILAAHLQFLIPPRKSLIWAVLHKEDNLNRLRYSLAATFLGRMCLSGDVCELESWQWSVARQAMDFYQLAWPVIRLGTSRLHGSRTPTFRNPTGWQAVVRLSEEGKTALVVFHTFMEAPRVEIDIPLGTEGSVWHLTATFGEEESGCHISVVSDCIKIRPESEFQGLALLLEIAE